MEKKVIIYTNKTCSYCKQMVKKLNEEKINFIERNNEEFTGEWYKVSNHTGLPMFPTILVNNNYLVPGRDFNSLDQVIGMIDYLMSSEYPNWSNEEIIIEKIKTIKYNNITNNRQLNIRLNKIEEKLNEI
jgi:glutaredoxin